MSVRATLGVTMNVVETVSANADYVNSSRNSVTFDGLTEEQALTATTTPPVTVHAIGSQALSSGSGTIDLTALTGLNGVAVSLSGLKPRAFLFENPAANANVITIAKGATNGYTGLGANFSIALQPGQKALILLDAAGTAVSGSVKTLDITGTGSQALKYQTVAGA